MFEPIELGNPHLRKIQWAVLSPSLLSYPYCVEYIRDEAHALSISSLLAELDRSPDEVDAHFAQFATLPMGKYFEQLVFYLVEKDPRFEIVLKNHQIADEKQTVGEIDILLRDTQSAALEHWEIAIKYYLQKTPSPQHAAMVGPNAVDNLAAKMKKLTDHQLPLSSHPTFQAMFDGASIENRLFMKGQFFYHFQNKKVLPEYVRPEHEQAAWCFISQATLALDNSLRWKIIQKPDWIGPFLPKPEEVVPFHDLLTLLKQHFSSSHHSLLCIGFNGTQEVQRFFVVQNGWPDEMH